MIFTSLQDERGILLQHATEMAQRDAFLRTLAADPEGTARLADLVSEWGNHAPTLPPGAIWGLAHARISPGSDIGQKVIRQGVPATSQPQSALDRALASITPDELGQVPPTASIGPQTGDYGPSATPTDILTGEPSSGSGLLGSIESGIGGAVGAAVQGISAGYEKLNENIRQQHAGVQSELSQHVGPAVSSVLHSGNAPVENVAFGGHQQAQQAGFANADVGKTIAREAAVVGNTGLQAVEVPIRLGGAAMNEYVRHNPAGSTYGGPFGTKWTVGSVADALDPEQFTLYQQLHGKSVGSGILPGGPATEAATAAQQRAGSINGHAMTYGRALASMVSEPGTRPYSIMSGTVDAGVALGLDPMSMALKAGSGSLAAAREFAPLTDSAASNVAHYLVDNARTSEAMTGLSNFARADGVDLVEALATRAKTDPGSISNIARSLGMDTKGLYRSAAGPQAGIFVGMRPFVHKDTALQYLSSKSGNDLAKWLAENQSFRAIRSRMGDQFPVDVVASLRKANSPEEVRALLSQELGTTMAGPGSFKWIRPPEDMRLFTQLPKEWIDYTNNQQAVQQAERYLAVTKYPRDQWDAVLEPIASATNIGEMRNAVELGLGGALQEHLVADGVPPRLAKDMVTFHQIQNEQQRKFYTDELGQPIRSAGMSLDGEPAPILGPFSWNELARGTAPLDPRRLRQATQKYRQLLHFWNDGYLSDAANIPAVRAQIERAVQKGEPLSTKEIAKRYANATGAKVSRVTHEMVMAESLITDQLTSYFKGMTLSALRVPVRFLGDEHMAMAVSGIDSMFSGHPFRYMAITAGNKAAHDIEGVPWVDYIGDAQSYYARALGRAAKDNPSPWTVEQQMLKHYVEYGKEDKHYLRGWIDNISKLHLSSPDREVARAILDPNYQPAGITGDLRGLDAVKEWFSNGPGFKYLDDLRGADLKWGSRHLNSRSVADHYVDELRNRVMMTTAGDEKLLDAAAHGTPFNFRKANQGIRKSTSPEFQMYLHDIKDELGPTVVTTRAAATGRSHARLFDWAADKMLGALMDYPARTLTRSPAFKQYYYKQVQRLLDFMTPEAQIAALKNAAEDGMKLRKPIANGALEIHEANVIAQANSLAKMKTYLYYPGEKTTAEDILRNVMPFAPAWHSVLKRWSHLAIEHPQIIRHGQQGVQSLQSSGFFHPEPGLGTGDFFSMGGPAFVKAITGATGFNLEGSVAGLNMFTGTWATSHGLPGVGPVVQLPAAMVTPHSPITKAIKDFISPYGDPDISGGFFESLFPGWLQKMRAGGYLSPVGWDRTNKQQVVFDDLVKQTFTTMVSSGRFDLSDQDLLQRLLGQAKAQAQKLYLLRGLAQFVVPSAPQYSAKATLKDGRAITLYKITAHYSDLLKKYKGDGQKATLDLVNDYGPELIYGARPKNLNLVGGGLHAADQVLLWKQQHTNFAGKFPSLFGYWVPAETVGRSGSPQGYFDLIKSGDIAPLSPKLWSEAADQYLGNVMYSEDRAKLGPSLNKAQREWLGQRAIAIQKVHPFFRVELGLPSRNTRQQQIVQLYGLPGEKGALDDPTVKDTPLARAAKSYLELRDYALRTNKKNQVTGQLSGKTMAAWRDWLYQNGTEIARRTPEFTTMWNTLLQPEVDPNG